MTEKTASIIARLTEAELESVLRRIQRYSRYDPARGCVIWIGSRDEREYGRIRVGGRRGRIERAHRVAWELANGPIPPETPWLRHDCDNPSCINPQHLRPGTPQDNSDDMTERRRGHTKLTTREVVETFGLRMLGVSKANLAKTYGAKPRTIRAVLAGVRREGAFDTELKKDHERHSDIEASPEDLNDAAD